MNKASMAQGLGGWMAHCRNAVSYLWRCEARLRGVEMPGHVLFQGRPLLSVAPGSQLRLGDGVVIASAVRANPLGCFQPSVLRTLAAGARLILHARVGLSATVLCAGRQIEVGEGTIFGSGAMVLDNDFHVPTGDWGWAFECCDNAKPVTIGRGVFVGARAIILKGVTIGDRAVIGAGAVVTKDVPAGHVAAGNPVQVFAPKTMVKA